MEGKKLNVDELEAVTGGVIPKRTAAGKTTVKNILNGNTVSSNTISGNTISSNSIMNAQDTKLAFCPTCEQETEFKLFTGGRAVCPVCGDQITL